MWLSDIEPVPATTFASIFRTENRVVWFFSSPQFEKGNVPTLYQPTDDTLNETDEYGAWFCRAVWAARSSTLCCGWSRTVPSVPATIRSSSTPTAADTSPAAVSAGTKDSIILQDVTIRWEDLDEEMQEQMRPRFVTIEGGTVFHYPMPFQTICDPGGNPPDGHGAESDSGFLPLGIPCCGRRVERHRRKLVRLHAHAGLSRAGKVGTC